MTSPTPPGSRCASCGSRLLPDLAVANWLWGKRCQQCRARYCRACVGRHVRVGKEQIGRSVLHEVAHQHLLVVDLEDVAVHAPLGRYDRRARFGSIRPPGAAFRVGDEVFADVQEAAAEVFVRYAVEPETLDVPLRRWVERTSVRHGLSWVELAQDIRDSGDVTSEFSSVYRCGYCGHRWGEVGAAQY